MSVILFTTLSVVFVARFLAFRVGRVAVKRRIIIVVNCLIDPALILPHVLITMDLTLQIPLLARFISLKRLL